MYNFTILLTLWNSEEKNGLLKNFFFVFHPILMKLGEIVEHMDNYNFTKFHQNQMKNKKVLLILACFSVQNFKVSVELWKLYIVRTMIVRVDGGNFLGLIYVINSEIFGVPSHHPWAPSLVSPLVVSMDLLSQVIFQHICSKL